MTEITDKDIKELEEAGFDSVAEFVKTILESPYLKGYKAVLTTIDNLNQELMEGVAKIKPEEEGNGDKQFERSHRYILEMKPYYDQLEYFRSKMTGAELKQEEKTGKSKGIAV